MYEAEPHPPIRPTRQLVRVALGFVIGGGLVLGAWHNLMAVRSLWVFSAGEPLASWIIVLAGPFSTLPALLIAVVSRSWGGRWLLGGGLLSLCFVGGSEVMNGEGAGDVTMAAFSYSAVVAFPMVSIGILLRLIHRRL